MKLDETTYEGIENAPMTQKGHIFEQGSDGHRFCIVRTGCS